MKLWLKSLALRLCRPMCGEATPRRDEQLAIGLRPSFGLRPKFLGQGPYQGRSPVFFFSRTSDGEAVLHDGETTQ